MEMTPTPTCKQWLSGLSVCCHSTEHCLPEQGISAVELGLPAVALVGRCRPAMVAAMLTRAQLGRVPSCSSGNGSAGLTLRASRPSRNLRVKSAGDTEASPALGGVPPTTGGNGGGSGGGGDGSGGNGSGAVTGAILAGRAIDSLPAGVQH